MSSSSQPLNLTESQAWSLSQAQVAAGISASECECAICCEVFTKQRRKPIRCNACDYVACNNCYKQFLTSDGVSRPKCMNRDCNTEWTLGFLKENFSDSFISGELREHTTKILFQQQIAMLAATQPAVERRIRVLQTRTDIIDIDRQMNELLIRKRILQQEARILEHGGEAAGDESAAAGFHHKCCDPECLGFVSSAWKCGLCEKFSCAHCHEVKGATTEEVEAHVCEAGNIETVKLLKSDTKPCPGCGTYIFKTEGCDQMFCICCKKLWSWNTGRIEERGHNPHYLEWMRNRNGGVGGGGGGGELVRDPADIQCGREIDWRFNNSLFTTFRVLSNRAICEPRALEEMRVTISKWCESLIHSRHHDIPTFRAGSETNQPLEQLRISYMMKQIPASHFRLRVFQIHRNAGVNRQITELMVAMQNAATDIMYRIHDTLTGILNSSSASGVNNPRLIRIVEVEAQLREMSELRAYASDCLAEIYRSSSKTAKYAFIRDCSFALIM